MFKILARSSPSYYLVISKNYRTAQRIRESFLFLNTKRNFCLSRSLASSDKMASGSNAEPPKFTNRLAQEKSPYLLQHAHNPVDWYPWGDEAIKKAKAENKMIFLSVGYSTCHWCHVMEHESFEDEGIAKIMNEKFVNIKVDREERPDIDKIYMNFVLMINGSGGWPMSVWLTPELAPITAGTYFPPSDKWGMPGFRTVLTKISEKWDENQIELAHTGQRIIQAIRKTLTEKSADPPSDNPLTAEGKLDQCLKIFKRHFDQEFGGFGSKPKFPEVAKLNFLFHAYVVKKDFDILDMVLKTLQKLAYGGIHDHIFGGFARYSVDRKWHIPHFEKMLYDQGQLISAYVNAYKITKDKFYLDVADDIYRYMMKDLRHPFGGFYSGEDADSLPVATDKVKIEGAFYAWTYSEIRDELHENASKFDLDVEKVFEIYAHHYDIRETGNVEPSSDPHGHLTAKNVLIMRNAADATCEKFEISKDELGKLLATANDILHTVRDERPRPHLDTKIITAWNGLVLSGLAKLANCDADKEKEYLKAAKDLVDFTRKYLFDKEKKILLRSCYGTGNELAEVLSEPIAGFLDDYAFLIKGLLDYYRTTLDIEVLKWAKELQDIQDSLFWDETYGGYFYSQADAPNVVVRLKEDHDGAEPCGNSVAGRNLLLISAYYEDSTYKQRARKLFDYFEHTSPFGYVLPEMMSSLLLLDRGLEMMAIFGPSSEETNKFIEIGQKYFIPGMILVHFDPDNPQCVTRKTFEKFKMVNNKSTVYICHNQACQLPITDPVKLEELFKENHIVN